MTRNGFPARLRISHQIRRETEIRRRNGKLQACEPCRKGKLRCDHMMPACGRCSRRNKPEQCVYHPAPLTKNNSDSLPTPQTTDAGTPSVVSSYELNAAVLSTLQFPPFDEPAPPQLISRANSLPAQTGVAVNHTLHQSIDDESPRALSDHRIQSDTGSLHEASNFLSHFALLAENESSIGILPPHPQLLSASNIPQRYIERGALVLSLLKDLPLFNKYIDKWFSFTRGVIIIEPMVETWSSVLWSTWHKVLESQKWEGLCQMSEKVWSNTMKPLSNILNRQTTPREFVANITGENLRWEVVGIILTLVGLLAQSLQDGDPIFCSHDDPPVDRSALAQKTYSASDSIVTFCMDFDVMNDTALWLMYESTILGCSLHAKGSYYNFQKSGQLYNALIAFGLNQEIKVDDHTPFFIAEIRKRLFVCAYENDKYTAAFAGRPPRLTRQYCRIQLPLDLNDTQTMSDGIDLENALANLDHDGWNRCGTVQRCTSARIFASNALITEEILEISIGQTPIEDIWQRATDIETRATRIWESMPGFLKIDREHPWDTKRAPIELLFLAHIKLANLGHHFLLQRTLIKKVGADSARLLAVAKETFDFILVLMNHREIFRDFQMDITQLLCMNGIPAAAVVAVELLHQEQDLSSTSALANPLPRSDTIQDLSVLVASLGTVRPESGAYAICERGRTFLKKILDTILSPVSSPTAIRSTSSVEGMGDVGFATPLFHTGSDGDFVRWLESMDWEQEAWSSLN